MATKRLQDLLNNLKDDVFCRLRRSKIAGVGVFALKPIPQGINPFKGEIDCNFVKVTPEELKMAELAPEVETYFKDMFVFDEGVYWMPDYGMNSINIGYFLNHSKTPNMGTDDGENFISLRAIKKGEELTVDYGTYNEENSDDSFIKKTPAKKTAKKKGK